MGKISLSAGVMLTSILLMACGGGSGNSSDTSDSLLQPVEENGVPLNNLERSREDADNVDHHIDDSSGLPLDNLHRDKSDDIHEEEATD